MPGGDQKEALRETWREHHPALQTPSKGWQKSDTGPVQFSVGVSLPFITKKTFG